jgi:hypothetical protein
MQPNTRHLSLLHSVQYSAVSTWCKVTLICRRRYCSISERKFTQYCSVQPHRIPSGCCSRILAYMPALAAATCSRKHKQITPNRHLRLPCVQAALLPLLCCCQLQRCQGAGMLRSRQASSQACLPHRLCSARTGAAAPVHALLLLPLSPPHAAPRLRCCSRSCWPAASCPCCQRSLQGRVCRKAVCRTVRVARLVVAYMHCKWPVLLPHA